MRQTPRSWADSIEEFLQIQEEFLQLQKRIEVGRDSVTDSIVRLLVEGWQRRIDDCIADSHICKSCRLIMEGSF